MPAEPPSTLTTTTTATLARPDDNQDEYEELNPPENFALVCSGVYRSAFPLKKNFPFLKKLRLKSVLTLILEDYPEQNELFLIENGIKFYQFGVPGNKEPFVDIPEQTICRAVEILMDSRTHPVLIHCNKGKHRTGCLVGCLRKMQSWSYTSIFAEYRFFSGTKSRSTDQQFIQLFDTRRVRLSCWQTLPLWNELGERYYYWKGHQIRALAISDMNVGNQVTITSSIDAL
jgi:tyrosine-protein phosphatase SIW14